MPFSTCYVPAVRGACCRTIFLTGIPCIRTFGTGGQMARGKRSMIRCVVSSKPRKVVTPNPVQPFWTVSRSRRLKKGPRGYDAGKKVNGRKGHLLVDTLGLVLMVVVHAASV